ncbi:exonuclease domain-containing protein, partial [Stappia sp.]|uniref:exonuclease domain-containing protein n=1 Tax=Stappia sp. TaxID=1870903 RepID=UPI003A98FE13
MIFGPAGNGNGQPVGATPLIGLDVVVLDTETTGLDIRKDRVVQVGALRMEGIEIHADRRFERLVDPGIPIPDVSRRVHGLGDEDLRGAAGFAEVGPALLDFIGDAVVVGHSIHFDLAILRHEADRHGIAWREPRALDVALMVAGLDREMIDTSLDSLALGLGIPIEGRHTAIGDALATARIYSAFSPRLLASGIRTLAEAENLCRRPAGLIARQEEAGWFARPTDRPDFSRTTLKTGSQRAIDSFLYRQRLGDVMNSPPISIRAEASLHEAATLMAERSIGCLIVDPPAPGHDTGDGPSDGRARDASRDTGGDPGILTERDVLHALAREGAAASTVTVGSIMSHPVISAPAETFLYRALGLMARRNLRYIGVTDAAGRLAGVFTLRTLLRKRALATLTVGDEIATARRPRDLARVQAALPSLAAGLLADG